MVYSNKYARFDRYLFADYSGAGEHHTPQSCLAVYMADGKGTPEPVLTPATPYFSRDTFREFIVSEIGRAAKSGARLVFGFDHSFSWPEYMWQLAGLADLEWKDAVIALVNGPGALPALDIPQRYCRLFNEFTGADVFWSPIKRQAESYGVPESKSAIHETRERFRISEKILLEAGFSPKPNDAVGGSGEGAVGGQTVCGLYQIGRLMDADIIRDQVAWWPFDGPDIDGPAYKGKHVGLEIYPAIFSPPSGKIPSGMKTKDHADAFFTCLAVQTADRLGWLGQWMNLTGLAAADLKTAALEGWILSAPT